MGSYVVVHQQLIIIMEYNVCVESLFSLGVVLLGLKDRCCSLTFSVALKRYIKTINYRVVYSSIACYMPTAGRHLLTSLLFSVPYYSYIKRHQS